jgi:nicotinate-nucleotide adenylyltransferase
VGGIGILGGSFNPVHLGHLRMAVEVRVALNLDRVEFVPAAVPPHKQGDDLLPFALRCELIRRSIRGREGLALNDLEGEREGPSYTVDTLRHYGERLPEAELFFILGTPDLISLPTWHRWQDLFGLANLVAVEREGYSRQDVAGFLNRHFPNVVRERRAQEDVWDITGGRSLQYLSVTRMDISSTRIREALRKGGSIAYLVPREVEERLTSLDFHAAP